MPHRGSVGISPARAGVRARLGSARVSPACSHPGAGVSGSPGIPARVLGIRTPRTPPSSRVGEGGWGDAHRGGCFGKPLRAISRFQPSGRPDSLFSLRRRRCRGDAHRGGCFGKPLRAISRFQPSGRPARPLLPLWEKGVGGMRGKRARECRKWRIAPMNATFEGRHRRMGMNTGEPRIVF
jgi:hypothetical protein